MSFMERVTLRVCSTANAGEVFGWLGKREADEVRRLPPFRKGRESMGTRLLNP